MRLLKSKKISRTRVVCRDVATGKSKCLTVIDSSPGEVLDLLRQHVESNAKRGPLPKSDRN